MLRLTIFGAAGKLGRHVTAAAKSAGAQVTLVARSPGKLDANLGSDAQVIGLDIMATDDLAPVLQDRDAIINVAGNAADGDRFCELVAHLVGGLEKLPDSRRPFAWFLGGAGVLDIGATGARGIDLPLVPSMYKTHARNHDRLSRSTIDWSLLCPGQLTDTPGAGVDRLVVSTDTLPVDIPAHARFLPRPMLLPLVASKLGRLQLSYRDAAAFLVAQSPAEPALHAKRVGLCPRPGS